MNAKRANLDEIINVIGEKEALELVNQIGGSTYYFPPDGVESTHVSIDPVAWKKMCRHFSGWVYVPNCKMAEISRRDAEIRAAYSEGAHILDLVRRYRLSDRRIKQICAGAVRKRRSEALPV